MCEQEPEQKLVYMVEFSISETECEEMADVIRIYKNNKSPGTDEFVGVLVKYRVFLAFLSLLDFVFFKSKRCC